MENAWLQAADRKHRHPDTAGGRSSRTRGPSRGEIDHADPRGNGGGVRALRCRRTDAGVTTLGQVAHLELYTDLSTRHAAARINDALPADIFIHAVDKVPHRFHARHDARQRGYLRSPAQDRILQGLLVDQGTARRGAMRAATLVLRRPPRLRVVHRGDEPGRSPRRCSSIALRSRRTGDLVLIRSPARTSSGASSGDPSAS